jgi:hypothetical protein
LTTGDAAVTIIWNRNKRCSFDEQYAQDALLQAALASAEPARRVSELMLLLFGTAKESFTMTRLHTVSTLICLLLAWLNTSSSSTGVLAAFTPQQPLSFNFFTGANESWFEYPEKPSSGNYTITSLLDRPRLGVAIFGGGFRCLQINLIWHGMLHSCPNKLAAAAANCT